MVSVRLENVSKKFGPNNAVDGVSFSVNDKEFFVMLGPSGCGKSTTLNMIAGLEQPTSGQIFFDDQLVNNVPAEKRDIAMVFQSFALYPNYTVFDNIAFPLVIRKMARSEIKTKVEEAAARLRITHLLTKRPHQLSGGERQRVALARAIVRQPKIILLDEPLSNLDAMLRSHVRAELITLQKDLAITTIYVTHDQIEAMTMGDRVIVLNQGKISQIGEPIEVFRRPANLFVAGFIGAPQMNFFPCRLDMKNGDGWLVSDVFNLSIDPVTGRTLTQKVDSHGLVMGVRPQNLMISTEKKANDDFQGTIFAIEPLGTETIVDVRVGSEMTRAVVPDLFSAEYGSKVWVHVDKNKMQLFDRETQLALM